MPIKKEGLQELPVKKEEPQDTQQQGQMQEDPPIQSHLHQCLEEGCLGVLCAEGECW